MLAAAAGLPWLLFNVAIKDQKIGRKAGATPDVAARGRVPQTIAARR